MSTRTMEQIREGRNFVPTSFKHAKESIIGPIWFAGWYPHYAIGIAVAIGAFAILNWQLDWDTIVWFVLLGIAWWLLGVVYVNRTATPIKGAFIADARTNATEIIGMGGDVNTYTLQYRSGSVPLVKPSRYHRPTSLVVGESSAVFHEDAELDLAQLSQSIGDNTTEVFYDQVASVTYDEPNLIVQLSTGNTHKFHSTRNPDDVLYDLQQRIREHKA